MDRYICIHGHFYQPPRENPWLEAVEMQDSAYPFHDWNERITAECYAPNSASRILGYAMEIIDIKNNYAHMSFNFGPTILSYLEKNIPEIYQKIIESDRKSQERFSGHGSAMAQAYNHIIMPLANERDLETQVIWGIEDFKYRFNRDPEGMWLPETAVNTKVLEELAKHNIKFTVLSPYQADKVRKIGSDGKWTDVKWGRIDTKMPYVCPLPSGRSINIFFYDGGISHDIAFGRLLDNGEEFARRLRLAFDDEVVSPQIVSVATDGETYGHHHHFGDMALAYCFRTIERDMFARITVFGEYLEKFPPEYEVKILENTSWSCYHGIERWRANCSCNVGVFPGRKQEWRKPLRDAMNWLRDTVAQIYEKEMSNFEVNPWDLRNKYIRVILDRSENNVKKFIEENIPRRITDQEKVKFLKLLEMQRNAMLMFTSCGWYFDEISGLEAVQIMQYAARVIQIANEITGIDLEKEYLEILEKAPSNIPEFKNGANVWNMFVKPAVTNMIRFGAHYAISSVFTEYPQNSDIYCYSVKCENCRVEELGKQKLLVGKVTINSKITFESKELMFAVMYMGDHNIYCGVREFAGENVFDVMYKEIKKAFRISDISEVFRIMDRYFGTHSYSIHDLFKDEQNKILSLVIESEIEEIKNLMTQIYKDNYPVMQMMRDLKIPVPKIFSNIAGLILDNDFKKLMSEQKPDIDKLKIIINEMKKWTGEIDKLNTAYIISKKIENIMKELKSNPEDINLIKYIIGFVEIITTLPLDIDMWKSQNYFLEIKNDMYEVMKSKRQSDVYAGQWVENFIHLGRILKIKID